MTPRDTAFEQMLERILDAEPLDWGVAEANHDPRFDALRALAEVADAFGRIGSPAPRAVLFAWGPLDVVERVAEGGSAEVYRAHDRRLGRDVALKLLKPEAAERWRAGRFLDEARRLACVRDAHVVSVYGAGVHDGRAGLWCEWIDGRTLADCVERDGPFGSAETAVAGLALCRALAAVHRAGLMHGDVKPHNILRERGGRIVLADLGAGGEPAALNASLRTQASPAWTAPEVLDGAARSPRDDLHSLGGVLHYLLDARAPDPRMPGAALARADVDPALHAVIARARAADPAARYASAEEMAADLAACLQPKPVAAAPARRRRFAFAGAAVAAVALLAIALVMLARPAAPPTATVELLRHADGRSHVLADGASVALRDRLSFAIESAQPLWVYVFNADDDGRLTRLFPLTGLDTRNPLPSGRRSELPGLAAGRALHIEVSSPAQVERFLVVAGTQVVGELEMIGTDQASIDTDIRTRGSQRLVPQVSPLPPDRLDALVARLEASPQPLRIWRFRLPHRNK